MKVSVPRTATSEKRFAGSTMQVFEAQGLVLMESHWMVGSSAQTAASAGVVGVGRGSGLNALASRAWKPTASRLAMANSLIEMDPGHSALLWLTEVFYQLSGSR